MDANSSSNEKTGDDQSAEDMHTNSAYVRTVVTVHNLRDKAKDAVDSFHEKNSSDKVNESWSKTETAVKTKTRKFCAHPEDVKLDYIPQEYGYVFRQKSCWELVLLGGMVCGIEFCYSAETAFVTPILLGLGLNIKFVTMIWCLSPLIGLILSPILGSMSDSCEASMGRRRPFILLYSIGILTGLILVSNGHLIGLALGDHDHLHVNPLSPINLTNNNDTEFGSRKLQEMLKTTQLELINEKEVLKEPQFFHTFDTSKGTEPEMNPENPSHAEREHAFDTAFEKSLDLSSKQEIDTIFTTTVGVADKSTPNTIPEQRRRRVTEETAKPTSNIQPWSIVFTIIGTMLLDFCSDACQSPSRTYMLDVSIPGDHAAGLSTFTLMAGLGGAIGFMMGAIEWQDTFLGHLLGSQVTVVFTIVTVVFIVCLITNLCSFSEIPLSVLRNPKMFGEYQKKLLSGSSQASGHEISVINSKQPAYGAMEQNNVFGNPSEGTNDKVQAILPPSPENQVVIQHGKSPVIEIDVAAELTTAHEHPTLLDFLKSIVHMPKSLKILCLTNLFCWMSLVCYSLYFTEFVAECVFGGNPQAAEGTQENSQYEDGVRFGCWGMSLNSLSCAIYSYFIEALIKKIGAKTTYIGGQMVYSIGMVIMAVTRHKVAVILLSPTAGVMYATLFTMPYLLIAHYHCTNKFSDDDKEDVNIRGIGTDVAAVSSMVFLSQLVLSISMGTIVEAVGSNVATVCAASLLGVCGALCATQVMYFDI